MKKNTGIDPTKAAEGSPDLIKDVPSGKPSGTGIGELVGGQNVAKDVRQNAHAQEEAYWRENHSAQDFAQGRAYDEFHHAYRAGYEGFSQFGIAGNNFEETETKLRERYESENGSPQLPWTVVRPATHAAWHRAKGQKESS